ncbi:WD40 repeat-like protein [Rozella allomycis CSF55]|uniref:WD40 repeat-like protein n=1 Tax=Rozella allomycis (strain CSF55) TaxID=988480 RepID=A0A075AYP3_ROZAC|nr:hypothetical protein O9G_005211 [Rozella allomycis CSF55]RKP17062.1 WD40 repeat-like protein [Rozella allomycis CSF55]|eukprot:EPZ33837.1 hypothetical protein O9G_005211 [Rozella allomycis CSF55]
MKLKRILLRYYPPGKKKSLHDSKRSDIESVVAQVYRIEPYISPNKRDLVTKMIQNSESQKEVAHFKGHEDVTVNATFNSPFDNYLISCSMDKTVRVWDIPKEKQLMKLNHDDGVVCLSFEQTEQTLASAALDGNVSLWDLRIRNPINSFKAHDAEVYDISLSHMNSLLLTVGLDKTRYLFLDGFSDFVSSALFPYNASLIATTCLDGNVRVYDALTGNLLQQIE